MGATHFDERRTTMRAWYLMVLLLTTEICFSQAPNKKAVGCAGCFSEPHSTLLFSPLSGDTYFGDLALVTPSGKFIVLQPPGRLEFHNSSPLAISPSADRVAASLLLQFLGGRVNCGSA